MGVGMANRLPPPLHHNVVKTACTLTPNTMGGGGIHPPYEIFYL